MQTITGDIKISMHSTISFAEAFDTLLIRHRYSVIHSDNYKDAINPNSDEGLLPQITMMISDCLVGALAGLFLQFKDIERRKLAVRSFFANVDAILEQPSMLMIPLEIDLTEEGIIPEDLYRFLYNDRLYNYEIEAIYNFMPEHKNDEHILRMECNAFPSFFLIEDKNVTPLAMKITTVALQLATADHIRKLNYSWPQEEHYNHIKNAIITAAKL